MSAADPRLVVMVAGTPMAYPGIVAACATFGLRDVIETNNAETLRSVLLAIEAVLVVSEQNDGGQDPEIARVGRVAFERAAAAVRAGTDAGALPREIAQHAFSVRVTGESPSDVRAVLDRALKPTPKD